ncbi:hypothetical protein K439DRAFT_1635411 [Ramaria rubella]|nr:hypothetical protein K439DRAFT_1635411 [Ramaria rubella]
MATNMSSLLSTTTNLSSVAFRSMLSMPTRFFNNIRRVDDLLTADIHAQQTERGHQHHPFLVSLPGPWAFITSGYALALLLMALLLNRIQHIVVPPRHTLVRRLARHYVYSRSRQSKFRFMLSLLLPLNLSSTVSRALIRSPSIYLLWRSLALFTIILLQASDLFPSASWLSPAAEWGNKTEMKEVCWNTFTSVCVALSIEALMRGLEGRGNSPSSPFNLFGYAFLLHIYSSPITHQTKAGDQGPTRPDRHVLVTIIIPLLQLTMLHTLGTRRRWVNQRLIPTAICGILTLLHFHYVLFFSSTSYPLINYLPSLLESVLLAIILLTISLHLLTQLLLEGHVTRPLLGHARTLSPRWDEDFAVALLRVGTASLDATSAAGLGNEVIGIGAGSVSVNHAEVELGPAEIIGIRSGTGGFGNEIKHVRAITANEGDGWVDMLWLREWAKFLGGLWALLKGSWRLLLRTLRKRLGRGTNDEAPVQPIVEESERPPVERTHAAEEDLYQRFLRGEAVSDDEDDFTDEDANDPERLRSPSPSPSDTETEADWGSRETAGLYGDISSFESRQDQSSPIAPVLLAHVASVNSSPLTRRQYSRLIARPEDGWTEFINERRSARASLEGETVDETRRSCVVCTVEAREVICWPCRCLALCDDCRANLASRFPASKHTCPCCRRSVEGYSRIYIP